MDFVPREEFEAVKALAAKARAENEALYKRYEALAAARSDVWFVGRLATYRYYNMDQVTAMALTEADKLLTQDPPP